MILVKKCKGKTVQTQSYTEIEIIFLIFVHTEYFIRMGGMCLTLTFCIVLFNLYHPFIIPYVQSSLTALY
jgi:hypothetical protein